jgi:hypothetical protein
MSKELIGGRPVVSVYNVSQPTMTVYSPNAENKGVAVVVFPGGGFEELAIDLEGTEVCDWLTSKGITCVLLKYRVPSLPYDWHCKCRPDGFVKSSLALEDAQRTIRTRLECLGFRQAGIWWRRLARTSSAVCTRRSMRLTRKAAVRILR